MKEALAAAHAGDCAKRNETRSELFDQNVVPSYSRFDLVLERGEGSYVWDVDGKRYLDLGGGIAVCSLGHAHPEITKALIEQSQKLIHVSNLYYNEPQGQLAERIVDQSRPGACFFATAARKRTKVCSSLRENLATTPAATKSSRLPIRFMDGPWPESPRPGRKK